MTTVSQNLYWMIKTLFMLNCNMHQQFLRKKTCNEMLAIREHTYLFELMRFCRVALWVVKAHYDLNRQLFHIVSNNF